MGLIGTILLVVFVIVSILLVLLVLLQNDEGNGMGGIFGGQNTQAFGARSGNVLTKTTYILVTIFFILIVSLALLNKTPKTSALDAAVIETSAEETTTATEYWEEETTSEVVPEVTEAVTE